MTDTAYMMQDSSDISLLSAVPHPNVFTLTQDRNCTHAVCYVLRSGGICLRREPLLLMNAWHSPRVDAIGGGMATSCTLRMCLQAHLWILRG